MPLYMDWTMILLIPPLLLTIWAQFKVKGSYAKYSQVGTRSGLTGAQVAERMLVEAQITPTRGDGDVRRRVCGLTAISGHLTDHYDPRESVLRLSEDVYHGQSVAALGIAAHEVGHAIQHANAYAPLMARSFIYPVTSFASTLSWPLLLGGLLMGWTGLLYLGILLFSFAVMFTIITLPVEFNASSRALAALSRGGILTADEMKGAKSVLTAAALTYVAAAAMAIMQLIRLILIARNR